MTLFVPSYPAFGGMFTNSSTGYYHSSTAGTGVLSGAVNTYGSYVEVLSDTTIDRDCYAIEVYLLAVSQSTFNRSAVITIGKDETGGTSYTDWIQHLIFAAPPASNSTPNGFRPYVFPVFIKAGTSIAVKHANATNGITARVVIKAYHTPLFPEATWCGSYVETFGGSASGGTAITIGDASEGSWTAMGSTLTRPLHFWQFGAQVQDATATTLINSFDLAIGDGSNKRIISEDLRLITTSTEIGVLVQPNTPLQFASGNTGDTVYIRGQCSGTPDTGYRAAAYGVG